MSYCQPVLVVEDDENDIAVLEAAFADLCVPNPVRVVRDGGEAIRYLLGAGDYQDRAAYPLPGLMLLDLQMPGMSGFGVLRWLRRQPELKAQMRVVVITSFAGLDTPQVVRQLGADEFFEKPLGYGLLKAQVRGALLRWQRAMDNTVLTPDKEP